MQDLPKLSTQLEFLLLKYLASNLQDGKMDIPYAKVRASTFLAIEPFASIEDAKAKMQKLAIQYPDCSFLQRYVDAYYSEQHKDKVVEQMREHIKQGNLDQALEVAKQ